jgi:cytochrome c oxidase subunit 2
VKSNQIVTVIVVGIVLIAIGIVVGATANWMPVQASAEAASVDTLFNVMLGIATVVFLIIEGGIVYSMIRFRAKPGDTSDGPAHHGSTWLEILWTLIPTVIVFMLGVYSFKVFSDQQTPQDNAVRIDVIGQQFKWSFMYSYQPFPELTDEQNEVAKANMISDQLHVPLNRPIETHITSIDVMHAFYVPEFRVKQDAIPGRNNIARFTPILAGTYSVVCTELCGQGHADMFTPVVVEEQAAYDAFVEQLRQNAKAGAIDPTRPERGKDIFKTKYPCGTCHVVTDVGTIGVVGPKLDGIATRAEQNANDRLTSSGVITAEQYLHLSIVNPSKYLVPGFGDLMPKTFSDPSAMPEDDRKAIVNYLLTLK